jgi:hypothetical protein
LLVDSFRRLGIQSESEFRLKSDNPRHASRTRHQKQTFFSVAMLALHKDDAKPKLPENDTLPHKCELCEWRFPNLNVLACHIKAKHC